MAKKDFDAERAARPRLAPSEREFVIGGEKFTHRTDDEIWPEMTFGLDELGTGIGEREALKILDQLVLDLIEADGHKRWLKLRERRENPITVADISSLIEWLLEAVTDRPPTLSESSPPTSETNGQSSTESSSPEPAAASVTST
jgi:hypothetical protein